MLKLYKNKTNFVAKGMGALTSSAVGTMIPMHVNAADHMSTTELGFCLCLYGGAVLAAIVGIAIYAICSRDNKFDADCSEAVKLNEKFNRSPFRDETTSAKQYFKIVNKK